ncbi:salicylic acid-binding protein 2-like [Durio zibethinus]|uniref:Salicylic acid-binding protein 2-like n=1 Tax=Durio zibethinus TaxID=66656 RepID=A0A6P5YNC5_DURZI|nr:salicylic acid-binding protein 2-like [Durio zibethinus]
MAYGSGTLETSIATPNTKGAAFLIVCDANLQLEIRGEDLFIKDWDPLWTQFAFNNGPHKPSTSYSLGPILCHPRYATYPLPRFLAFERRADISSFIHYKLGQDLTLAIMLARPFANQNDAASIEDTALARERCGSVRRVYIVCNKDKVTDEDFQRWMIENNPPDEVMLISDYDHMAMLPKPRELCSWLEESAVKYD